MSSRLSIERGVLSVLLRFFTAAILSLSTLPVRATVGAAAVVEPVTVHIGVLAHRGEAAAMEEWLPTARYLTAKLPPHVFTVVPLMNKNIGETVAHGEIDFVITNPGSYVNLEARYGVTRLLTLRSLREGKPYAVFGAVIFTRADRTDIRTLSDLKGRSFMAVDRNAFGGFQMAWHELLKAKVDPFRDIRVLKFAGLPQDNIVYAVRDGEVDAGTVRTDTLEHMASEGKIDLAMFRVINLRFDEDFPFVHSTQLYPEWAFARLKRTPEALAKKVTIALLQMSSGNPAARASHSAGWTVPLDYTPVHNLFRELHIEPYENLGKVTLSDVFRQYWPWAVASVASLVLLIAVMVYILRLNRGLKASQRQLRRLTGELGEANEALQQLSTRDGLTGLANRRLFDETLVREWKRAMRDGTPLSLIMIDIDLFKQYNDRYGHQAGDECLEMVAGMLQICATRAADLVARYGGEEFAAILPAVNNAGSLVVAERMRTGVEGLKIKHDDSGTGDNVSISLGVATRIPGRNSAPSELVAAADRALYQAKSGGRNLVRVAE